MYILKDMIVILSHLNYGCKKLFPSGLSAKVLTYLSRANIENTIDTNVDIPSYYDYLIDPDARNYAGVSIDISLPLLKSFSNSLVKGDVDSACAYLEQEEYELSDEIAKTVLNVSNCYWTYVVAYQKYNRLVESNRRLVTAMNNLRKLVQAGQRTSIELTKMQMNIAKSRTGVIVAHTDMETKRSAVLQSIGSSTKNYLAFSHPADGFPDPPEVAGLTSIVRLQEQGSLNRIFEKRADIKSLRRQVERAQLQAQLADIDCRPDINAYLSFGFDGTIYGDNELITAYGENIIGVNISGGVNFSLPLGKNRYGSVESAEAQYHQILLSLSEKIRNLQTDLDTAVLQVTGSRESLLNAFQVVVLSRDLLDADQKRFDAGLITVEDLYTSEEQFVDAESQYDESYRAYFQAITALKYCTGELYSRDGKSSLTKDDLLSLPK